MHVGITYDLRDEYLAEGHGEEATAEFDRGTIDAIATSLLELGHHVDRIGRARQLVRRLAAGDRWDLVFNICEGLKGMAREAQVPAILEVFDIPYTFADPLVMSLCLHKGLAKMVVERAGLPTPKSLLIESLEDLDNFALAFPLFAKPVAEGTGKGITLGLADFQPRGTRGSLRATPGPVPAAGTGGRVPAWPRVHGGRVGHRLPRPPSWARSKSFSCAMRNRASTRT